MGQLHTKLTSPEFRAWDQQQPDRHEFVNGRVFVMVGARRVHCDVAVHLTGSDHGVAAEIA